MGSRVPPVPASLRDNLAYGLGEDEAERWLAHAVRRADALLDAWRLAPLEVLPGGSESLCVLCDSTDGKTVLKLPASVTGGAAEIDALLAWDGNGAARLLRHEPAESAMLMEYLGRVGEGTYTLADVLDVADRLHAADAAGHFPSLEANLARRLAWADDRFAEPGHEQHRRDLEVAERLLADLVQEGRPVLLHGDLQPKNVIVSAEGLAVVDPMPSVGPELFDLALWVVKCGGDHAVTQCVEEVRSLRPGVDADALLRWAWCLAVLESRPYLGTANRRREQLVDLLREEVA